MGFWDNKIYIKVNDITERRNGLWDARGPILRVTIKAVVKARFNKKYKKMFTEYV